MSSNTLEHWIEGGKPCPKCGSFHTKKSITICLTTYPCQYKFKCEHCSHEWLDHEWYNGGLSYQPKPENLNPYREYGWICPKCGRVYSPTTNQCLYCGEGVLPNFIYCGNINNNTNNLCDNRSTPVADMAKNAIHEELKNSIQNSNK